MIPISDNARRIKRLLPYKIHINNSIKYHNFFKKGSFSCQILDVEYLSTNHYSNSEGRDIMRRKMISLLKKARPIKSLRLHKCIIRYENIPDDLLVHVTKKIARVQSLSLPQYVLSQDLIQKYICILKNIQGLKRFDYITPVITEFPDGYLRKFDEALKRFIHAIKRNKINTLNISHNTSDDRVGNSFLKFKHFPSSLNKLTFDWKHFSTGTENMSEICTSLGHMKNLDTLELAFRNQTDLLVSGLSSIPNLNKLTSLNIELLNQVGEDKPLPFNKMVGLSNLRSLKLKFDFWPTGLEGFFRNLKDCPLKVFSLDIVIDQDLRLHGLKDLISRMKNLEALTLKIYKLSIFESKNEFRHLFDKISSLKLLQSLKLSFMSFGSDEKQDMFMNFGAALKKLFTKSIKLQDFSFRTNQIHTNEAFPELISVLNCSSSSNLRKLKIDIGDYRPRESDSRKIIGMIKDLKNIEELKLKSLRLSLNQFACELINCISNMMHLQILELGEIKSVLNKQPIVNSIEKILSKRGLKKFDCLISFDCHESLARRNRNFAQIDLKKIVQKNPDLQSFPNSSVLFLRYEDDTEWKWSHCGSFV